MASVIRTLVGAPKDYEARAVASWAPGDRVHGLLRLPGVLRALWAAPGAVVHVHLSERGSLVREGLVLLVARAARRRVIATLHGAELLRDGEVGRVPRLVLSAASARVALTREQQAAVRRCGLTCAVVSNPVAASGDFDHTTGEEEAVLFCGEISTRKGADVLLAAWPQVHASYPRACLVLCGPQKDVEPRAEGSRHVGALPNSRVFELLRDCAVAVLPSRREVLPMFLIEAMSAGRRWVSTDTDGMRDLYLEGGGELVPVGDPDALATALIRALDMPLDERQAKESAAHDAWLVHHSPDQVARRYGDLYWPAGSPGAVAHERPRTESPARP